MNCDLKAPSFRSPWGFNKNSRGCSEAEPVVCRHTNNPNPAGVEQLSDNKTCIVHSTHTGSAKTATLSNHGFRFSPPAAIIVMTPMGSDTEGGAI